MKLSQAIAILKAYRSWLNFDVDDLQYTDEEVIEAMELIIGIYEKNKLLKTFLN